MPLPRIQCESLEEYVPFLVRMVAKTSWLPNPETVLSLKRAAFPTARARKLRPRFSRIVENDEAIGMYDDNTTPRWAIRWAHGIPGKGPQGFGYAHVWQASDGSVANSGVTAELLTRPQDQAA